MSASIFQAVDIFYEISKGNRKAVNAWVKSKPDTTICNEQGQSVLHAAVLTGDKKIVKAILKSNVDVNMLDKSGTTALDCAIDHGYKSIILEMIKHKAKVTTMENAEFVKVIIGQMGSGFSIGKILAIIGLCWIGAALTSFVLLADLFMAGDLLGWTLLVTGACSLCGAGILIINSWNKPLYVQFYEQESYQVTALH
jgi:hypothetical protein